MSRHSTIKQIKFRPIVYIVSSLVFIYFVTNDFILDPKLKSKKEIHLHSQDLKKSLPLRTTLKIKGPIEVKLKLVNSNDIPTPNIPFELEAEISIKENLDYISFKWDIPSQIGFQGSSLENTFSQLKANQTLKVIGTFIPLSSENQQIHAHVVSEYTGTTIGATAQYNTTEQVKIDMINAQSAQNTMNFIESNQLPAKIQSIEKNKNGLKVYQ